MDNMGMRGIKEKEDLDERIKCNDIYWPRMEG